MNTANLQLEGFYLVFAGLLNVLIHKGVLSRDEVAAALKGAERGALTDFRDDELSSANRDALAFPARLLTLAINTSPGSEFPSFSELAKMVGETKPQAGSRNTADSAVAFADGRTAGDAADTAQVRAAGPESMRDAPTVWDEADEAADESFPASDPPALNR